MQGTTTHLHLADKVTVTAGSHQVLKMLQFCKTILYISYFFPLVVLYVFKEFVHRLFKKKEMKSNKTNILIYQRVANKNSWGTTGLMQH